MKKKIMKILAPMPYKIKKPVLKAYYNFMEAGKVSEKGERLVVPSWNELIESGEFYHLYHAYRYWWASKILPRYINLLDLGCGSGYGSWYLWGNGNRTVVGYDTNIKVIEWAKKHFKESESLHYTNILKDQKFDVIVCFEVIEHDPQNVKKTIMRSLKRDGTLVISTANGSPESVRQYLINNKLVTVNPGHKKEFTPREFLELLKEDFLDVKLYGQCVKSVQDFTGWLGWRRKNNVRLLDFEMRPHDFKNCEVIVAKCRR